MSNRNMLNNKKKQKKVDRWNTEIYVRKVKFALGFPLARAKKEKWRITSASKFKFSIVLYLLSYNLPFFYTLSYDIKAHILHFICKFFTETLDLQWKDQQFPKGCILER